MHNETRQPHAVLNLPSRACKAEKFARLLALSSRKQPLRLLEIGTGSGGIAHWLPITRICVGMSLPWMSATTGNYVMTMPFNSLKVPN